MAVSTTEGTTVEFTAELIRVDGVALLRLPQETSQRLPSRGQVAVRGRVGDRPFETVVEPDGRRGHWIRVDAALPDAADLEEGAVVEVTLEVLESWPEPEVPPDLGDALAAATGEVQHIWEDITPMARWEWVRWVGATRSPDTRQRRVEVTISKIEAGKRRPCCFDLSSCTDPEVARSGKLPLS